MADTSSSDHATLPHTSTTAPRPPGNKAKVFAAKVNGVNTDFAVLSYSNRVFLSVSQCGRLGNLYQVQRDAAHQSPLAPSGTTIYDVRCLLGGEDPATLVAVRCLAEKLSLSKPLLVSLTLPSPSAGSVADIVALVAPCL